MKNAKNGLILGFTGICFIINPVNLVILSMNIYLFLIYFLEPYSPAPARGEVPVLPQRGELEGGLP